MFEWLNRRNYGNRVIQTVPKLIERHTSRSRLWHYGCVVCRNLKGGDQRGRD